MDVYFDKLASICLSNKGFTVCLMVPLSASTGSITDVLMTKDIFLEDKLAS